MTIIKGTRVGAALCITGFLAACNSSSPTASVPAPTAPATTPAPTSPTSPTMTVATSGMTGTGTTGTGTSTTGTGTTGGVSNSFITAFNAANVQLATATPLTGSADYTGEVEVHTTQATNDPDNVVFGDVAMNVNFDGAANPITATVSNIEGRIDGADTKVGGTLSSDGSSGINQVLALPVAGTTATSIAVQVEGALNDPTGTLTGDARMAITGTARGTDGASLIGANSVVITETGGANKLATGGRFYANK